MTMENQIQVSNVTKPTEMVVGLAAPFGANKSIATDALRAEAKLYGYEVCHIKISDIITTLKGSSERAGEINRITHLMDMGDKLREESENSAILAMFAIAEVSRKRSERNNDGRTIWLVDSIKNPEEVHELRKIYTNGFHLLAIHVDKQRRRQDFIEHKDDSDEKAVDRLIARDERGGSSTGQNVEKVFQYADYFIHYNGSADKVNNSISRFLGLLFGNPFINCTFNEYSMYLAYVAGMRSSDLSRQVGAVIAKNKEILSLGANDCPAYGGGLYWPLYDKKSENVVDAENGKDYMRGFDHNQHEKIRILNGICEVLGLEQNEENLAKLMQTDIASLTEYGRMVHAEMEAILGCARKGLSIVGATLYCTTFPCHNCAKHIIASGMSRVIFIEPYPKSKALEMHDDAITMREDTDKVVFEPYVGVGPRRFVDLFSMNLGSGVPVRRKDDTGKNLSFVKKKALPRLKMYPGGYEEREALVVGKLDEYIEKEGSDEKSVTPD